MNLNNVSILQKFTELGISIGHLKPNVIKAWQDTDCTKTKYLLQWICAAITEENCLSAYENSEFEKLYPIFINDELENETSMVNLQYPQIFNYNLNLFDIEVAEEEIKVFVTESLELNDHIKTSQKLKHRLANEYSQCVSEEIHSKLKKETVLKACLELGSQLDEMNNKLFEQLFKHNKTLNIYDFETTPRFITNFSIDEFENEFHSIVNSVNMSLETESNGDISATEAVKQTFQDLTMRICNSKICYLIENMKINELNQAIEFLDSFNVFSFYTFNDCDITKHYSKMDQLVFLQEMIKQSCQKYAENFVKPAKFESDNNDLLFCRSKLQYITKLEEPFHDIYTYYCILYLLYCFEENELSNLYDFFRWVKNYINKDLRNCTFRTDFMLKTIKEFEQFHVQPLEKKLPILEEINKLLCADKPLSSIEIANEILGIKNSIKGYQQKYFGHELKQQFKPSKLLQNISVMNKFLMSGPTNKISIIKPLLFSSIQQVNLSLDQQKIALKLILQITQSTTEKRNGDEWIKLKGQLWMHFLTDSEKFLAIFDELKREYKR